MKPYKNVMDFHFTPFTRLFLLIKNYCWFWYFHFTAYFLWRPASIQPSMVFIDRNYTVSNSLLVFFIMRHTSYKMEIISSAHASQYDMNMMEKEQQQRYRQTNGHKYCNSIYFSHEKSFISIEFHDCVHSRTRTLHSLSLGQINHEYLNWRLLLLDCLLEMVGWMAAQSIVCVRKNACD